MKGELVTICDRFKSLKHIGMFEGQRSEGRKAEGRKSESQKKLKIRRSKEYCIFSLSTELYD